MMTCKEWIDNLQKYKPDDDLRIIAIVPSGPDNTGVSIVELCEFQPTTPDEVPMVKLLLSKPVHIGFLSPDIWEKVKSWPRT